MQRNHKHAIPRSMAYRKRGKPQHMHNIYIWIRLGLLNPVAKAILLGGELKLEWQGDANPVMMTGETAMVYQGEIDYE